MDALPQIRTGGRRRESFGADDADASPPAAAALTNFFEDPCLQAPFEESSVFPLPNQSNINSCIVLGQNDCGCARVLIACWSGQVHLFQQRIMKNSDNSYRVMASFETLPLSDMPSDANILAVGGFYRHRQFARALSPARSAMTSRRPSMTLSPSANPVSNAAPRAHSPAPDTCAICTAVYRDPAAPGMMHSTTSTAIDSFQHANPSDMSVTSHQFSSAPSSSANYQQFPSDANAFFNIYTSLRDAAYAQQRQGSVQRTTAAALRVQLHSNTPPRPTFPSEEDIVKSMCDSCVSLPCDYLPIQIEHCVIPEHGFQDRWLDLVKNPRGLGTQPLVPSEDAWLVSSSDQALHLVLNPNSTYHSTPEDLAERSALSPPSLDREKVLPIQQLFPEIQKQYDSLITKFAVHYAGYFRFFAVAVSSGSVFISALDMRNLNAVLPVISTKVVDLDSPVLVLEFFCWNKHQFPASDNEKKAVNLLILPSLEAGLVYQDLLSLLNEDADNPNLATHTALLLPRSHFCDCPTTACVADVLLCGENQILIGTFGQMILIYTLSDQASELTSNSKENGNVTGAFGEMVLRCVIKCAHPIHSLIAADTTGDGLLELCCLSNKALHIYSLSEKSLVKKLKLLMNG